MHLALASCAALLSACGAREAPLTVGTNTWTGYEPLYLARDLGLHEGPSLRLVELAPPPRAWMDCAPARLMAGADAGRSPDARQEGIPIKVIWVWTFPRAPTRWWPATGGRAGGPARPQGGVEQTAVGAYMLNAALAKAGLRTTDITSAPALDEHLTAWRESQVDALVTFDPVLQVLRGEGAPVLFDSSAIPGEIVDVLVARTDALACCTQRISQLLAAHERALAPGYRAGGTLCGAWRRLGLTPTEMDAAFSGIELPDAAANRTLMSGQRRGWPPRRSAWRSPCSNRACCRRVDTTHLIDDRFVRGTTP